MIPEVSHPFRLRQTYCLQNNHNSPKNLVCYDSSCPNKGIICELCASNYHADHSTVSLEEYVNQMSSLFSSTNKNQLLTNVSAHSSHISKEIDSILHNMNSIQSSITQYITKLSSFKESFLNKLNDIELVYNQILKDSEKIRTKTDEPLPTKFVQNYMQMTQQLIDSEKKFECEIKNPQFTQRGSFDGKATLRSERLFQKYYNVINGAEVLSTTLERIQNRIKFRVDQFISNAENSFDFYHPINFDDSIEFSNPAKLIPEPQFPRQNDPCQDIITMFSHGPRKINIIPRASFSKISTIRDISESNGSTRFSCISEAGLQIWDYITGKRVKLIPKVRYGICLTKHNYFVCADNQMIRIMNMSNFKLVKSLKSSNRQTIRLYFDYSSDTLLSTGYGGALEAWDIRTGQLIFMIQQPGLPILSLTTAEIKKSSFLYFCDKLDITMFDLKQKVALKKKKSAGENFFLKILLIQGIYVIVAVSQSMVSVYDALTLDDIKQIEFPGLINSVMVVQDTLFLTIGPDGSVTLVQINMEKNFPIVRPQLKVNTERYALCWIDKANIMVYNIKSQRQQSAITSGVGDLGLVPTRLDGLLESTDQYYASEANDFNNGDDIVIAHY